MCLFGAVWTRSPHESHILKTAPGDNDQIFISEQTGFVWIYDREGTRLAEPFMDISDPFSLTTYDERGLLGMAFHPDFIPLP